MEEEGRKLQWGRHVYKIKYLLRGHGALSDGGRRNVGRKGLTGMCLSSNNIKEPQAAAYNVYSQAKDSGHIKFQCSPLQEADKGLQGCYP